MQAEGSGGEAPVRDWHVSRKGTRSGPYGQDELTDRIREGAVLAGDLVWHPSMEGWKPVRDIPALSRALPAVPRVARNTSSRAPAGRSWLSRFFRMFLTVLNPGILLKSYLKQYSWQWALTVSGVAFMLFFFQTSLDIRRTGAEGIGYVVAMVFTGLAYGTLGVAFLALLGWLMVKRYGNGQPANWAVKAFGLGYAPALVYTTMGLVFNIFFGWNTSLSFGIPGVLWATRPMMAALKEMTGGRKLVSLAMTAFLGLLLFIGWSRLV